MNIMFCMGLALGFILGFFVTCGVLLVAVDNAHRERRWNAYIRRRELNEVQVQINKRPY